MNAISILSLDNLNKDLTYSLLLVLSGILMDENGETIESMNGPVSCMHIMKVDLCTLFSYSS